MDPNKFILTLLNVVLLFLGLLGGLFFKLSASPLYFGLNSPVFTGIIIAFSYFVLSIAFFGMLTPVLFLFIGVVYSSSVISNPLGVLALIIAATFGSSVGNTLGEATNRDINQKENLSAYRDRVIIGVVIAIILGAIAGYIFGLNIQLDFLKDIFPLKIRI